MDEIKTSRFHRMKAWIHEHPAATYLLVGLGLVIVAGGVAYVVLVQKPHQDAYTPATVKKPDLIVKYYSPLTGVEVKNEAATTKPITAIMIENSPDARPQSGLKQAEVVYEAVTEGGITRFMALYQQNKPTLIGPVRSVRIYDLDWLAPWNASLAHVGGSAAALKEVRNGRYRDIDQFFNGTYYWRTTDRFAPHNVYTSFAKLSSLNKSKGYTASHPKPLLHATVKPAATLNATRITIHVSGATYDSAYGYDKTTRTYRRSEGGAPHVDREKGRITPTVIIAMYANAHQVYQDTWREIIKTSGSGKAVVFQYGTATAVTWHKSGHSGQLSFTDKDGKPFALARGQTWITALINGQGRATWHK